MKNFVLVVFFVNMRLDFKAFYGGLWAYNCGLLSSSNQPTLTMKLVDCLLKESWSRLLPCVVMDYIHYRIVFLQVNDQRSLEDEYVFYDGN